MKRILSIVLILFCMALSGCQNAAGNESINSNVETEAGKAAAETDSRVENTPADQPGGIKTEEQKRSDLLKKLYRQDGENQNAYLLPVELKENSYVTRMECFEDKLLIISSGAGLNVQLFNLDTGTILGDIHYDLGYEDLGEGGFLEDGTIWIFVPADETVYYLDEKLQEIHAEKTDVLFRSMWFCDNQGAVLWSVDYERDIFCYYKIDTKEIGEYSLETLLGKKEEGDGSWWTLDKVGNGYVYLTVTTDHHRKDIYRFSIESGEVVRDELAGTSAMSNSGTGSCYQFLDQYRIVNYSEPDCVINLAGADEKELLISYQNQYLFCGLKNSLNIYDCSRKQWYAAYKMELLEPEEELWNYISVTAVRPGMEQVIFTVASSQGGKIILCDLASMKENGKIAVTRLGIREIQEEIRAISNKIQQQYSLQMITMDEARERNDMSGYVLWDSISILDELDAAYLLEEYLDALPSGLVGEMLSEREEAVEICFSGTITGDESAGNLSYAGAYVTSGVYELNGESIFFTRMVSDVSLKDALQTNFAHEWFHLMEEHIWNCEMDLFWGEESAEQDGEAVSDTKKQLLENWENQWETLSPEDGYFYVYDQSLAFDEERGIDGYIGEEDMSEVYFIDAYSRTFPKEDRARIFENLYMSGLGVELPRCFESDHIRRKAVYLCQLIRCCYPSADTPGRNTWEKGLSDEDWQQIAGKNYR